jgi:hypothetical protein
MLETYILDTDSIISDRLLCQSSKGETSRQEHTKLKLDSWGTRWNRVSNKKRKPDDRDEDDIVDIPDPKRRSPE